MQQENSINKQGSQDFATAQAFASSWNNLPIESVYSFDQFQDWFAPLGKEDICDKDVLELGCGNGSLLVHLMRWQPRQVVGVDLGDSVVSARENLQQYKQVRIDQGDLTTYRNNNTFDLVYCIGVLHHLKEPKVGFNSVLENTKAGGKFHCWVYAKEGNLVVRLLVEPLRRITSRLPWWITKYAIATPLSFIFYLYAHLVRALCFIPLVMKLPLAEYSMWITKRGFLFFRHVAFDQLVTPQTQFINKQQLNEWLEDERIVPGSEYIIFRNGNSWKFGGIKK